MYSLILKNNKILLIFLMISFFNIISINAQINSNLRLTMSTNSLTYRVGDTLNLNYDVKNLGDEIKARLEVKVKFPDNNKCDLTGNNECDLTPSIVLSWNNDYCCGDPKIRIGNLCEEGRYFMNYKTDTYCCKKPAKVPAPLPKCHYTDEISIPPNNPPNPTAWTSTLFTYTFRQEHNLPDGEYSITTRLKNENGEDIVTPSVVGFGKRGIGRIDKLPPVSTSSILGNSAINDILTGKRQSIDIKDIFPYPDSTTSGNTTSTAFLVYGVLRVTDPTVELEGLFFRHGIETYLSKWQRKYGIQESGVIDSQTLNKAISLLSQREREYKINADDFRKYIRDNSIRYVIKNDHSEDVFANYFLTEEGEWYIKYVPIDHFLSINNRPSDSSVGIDVGIPFQQRLDDFVGKTPAFIWRDIDLNYKKTIIHELGHNVDIFLLKGTNNKHDERWSPVNVGNPSNPIIITTSIDDPSVNFYEISWINTDNTKTITSAKETLKKKYKFMKDSVFKGQEYNTNFGLERLNTFRSDVLGRPQAYEEAINQGFVSTYAATYPEEDFAETYVWYILNGLEFRRIIEGS
ncbi:MAG: hypothetical protein AABX33_06170 [Nanoarchaeota archaeon]